MKAVFVSDVNPARGHIYGLRVSSFARALARRGHKVVLLSPEHAPAGELGQAANLGRLLRAHDWKAPLAVSAPPLRAPLLELTRADGRHPVLRKLLTGYLLVFEGGVHGDFERGARPLADALARDFTPDIVWAVFGNSSTLVVGQRIARASGAAWFMDIKDNWESYTPPGSRAPMRYRFSDAAGFTSNAEVHGDIAARWLPHPRSILYSGVASEMIAAPGSRAEAEQFRLTLVGSTYRPEMLARFLGAFGRWVGKLPEADRTRVCLRYAGVSCESVEQAVAAAPPGCAVEVTGNVPHAELARLCQLAAANCYLWAPFGFHHKMLELLSTRRPAISFPGEHDESIRLAKEVGGELMACNSEEQLIAAFDTVWKRWRSGNLAGTAVDISAFTWDAGAAQLERLFADAIAGLGRRGLKPTRAG